MATIRAERTLKNLGKSRIKKEAMIKAGYSESYARAGQIQHTESWKELMENYIPDTKLAEVHKEGLEANNGELPDYNVRYKYLDSAYKLKGSYAPEKSQSVHLNLDAKLPDPESEALRLEYEEKLRAKLCN